MNDEDKTYLLKELMRTIDESDSTAAFCLCQRWILKDALVLLTAQEPAEPYMDFDGHDVWLCGNCHRKIFYPSHTEADNDEKNYRKFCFYCGRALKWK